MVEGGRRAQRRAAMVQAAMDVVRTKGPGVSVAENADRAIFGGFSEGHPGNKRRR